MKKLIQLLSVLALIFLLPFANYASHILSAELTYENIGGNRYRFSLVVNKDCDAIVTMPVNYNINYYSKSCNLATPRTFPVYMDASPSEVLTVCQGERTSCQGGTSTIKGILRYTYTGVFEVPATCNDWTFYFEERFRSKAVSNLQSPGDQLMYIEAKLNNRDFAGNSSPRFVDKGVGYICIGKSNTLSVGTDIDKDGDTYKYTLIQPKTLGGVSIPYNTSYGVTNPLGGNSSVTLNSFNGSLNVTADLAGQYAAVSVLVEEFRNGVLIGSVMRDFQILSQDCKNVSPSFRNKEAYNKAIEVCPGTTVAFELEAYDDDNPAKNQKLTLDKLNAGLMDSSFTKIGDGTANPKLRFKWTPTSANVGTRTITVIATDDFCPVKASTPLLITITVIQPPIASISDPADIRCDKAMPVNANVISNQGPFTYKWSTNPGTFGNASSIDVKAGAYWLVVKDSKGCISDTAKKVFATDLHAYYGFTKVCEGSFVTFTDSSHIDRGTHKIVKWSWNFGDSSPLDPKQNTSHQYAQKGIYKVKLTVTDDAGCVNDTIGDVKFCDLPIPNFVRDDSCQQNLVQYKDSSTVVYCGLTKYEFDYGDGQFHVAQDFKAVYDSTRAYFPKNPITQTYVHANYPGSPGTFDIRIRVTNEYGCTAIKSKEYTIYSRPDIKILAKDFYYKCGGDSLIIAEFKGENEPLKASWYTTKKRITTEGPDTLAARLGKPSIYTASVVDTLGCEWSESIQVQDPLIPSFEHTDYCSTLQELNFTSDTVSKLIDDRYLPQGKTFTKWGIKRWTWDFDDPGSPDQTTTNPSGTSVNNLYPETKNGIPYRIRLLVEDNRGCTDFVDSALFVMMPEVKFNLDLSKPFCLGGKVDAPTPITLSASSNRGRVINEIGWSFGDATGTALTGQKWKTGETGYTYTNYTTPPLNLTLPDSTRYYDLTHDYNKDGNYQVKSVTRFNRTCYLADSARIDVWPPFKMNFDIAGQCVGNPTTVTATSAGKYPVEKWEWIVKTGSDSYVPVSVFTNNYPGGIFKDSFDTTFTTSTNMQTDVVGTDIHGCKSYMEYVESYASIQLVPRPEYCTDPLVCENTTFLFKLCGDNGEGVIDRVFWDYGDGVIDTLERDIPSSHTYKQNGTYTLKISNHNDKGGCDVTQTIPLTVNPQPTAAFTVSDVCLHNASVFVNQSQSNDPVNPGLSKYFWELGDKDQDQTTSDLMNPQFTYKDAGDKKINLIVYNNVTGCTDTVNAQQTTIFPLPTAGFDWNKNKAVSLLPVEFTDRSVDATKWWYVFSDDNTIDSTANPIHTFTNIGAAGKVQVTQYVGNGYGCRDTISKSVDLNVYINYPNAFSPNDDDKNNSWSLIIKGGKMLKVLRIFNRWGEEVYDVSNVPVNSEGVVDISWDGKFNGKDQPIGSYIFYATVIDLHDKETKLDGKITLIR